MTESLPRVLDTRQIRAELKRLYDAIGNPSDDLCVVFSSAYLDKQLGAILKYVLITDEHNSVGSLLAGGQLASFVARINMAYCLGLISPWCYRTLKKIAEIRNMFAHSIGHVSFDDQDVKRLIDEDLKEPPIVNVISREWPPNRNSLFGTPRAKFETIVTTIVFLLARDSNTSYLSQFCCKVKAEDWSQPPGGPSTDNESSTPGP
jgi:hypothetical protein